MKRSQALISLSHEHHAALALARRAVAASRDVSATRELAAALPELFARELEPHFLIEEQLLLPPLRDAGERSRAARILDEHRQLRALGHATERSDPAGLASFGLLLEAHVRFEERELYPLAEAILPEAALAAVAACAAAEPSPHFSTTGAQTMASAPHLHLSPDAIYPFDARGIAKRFRHAAIFGALDALNPGETMRFVNDHDPLPLLDQLSTRYGETVTIRYVQREPGAVAIDFVKN
jgi:uncharacterized protein (DUF2249 family)